MLRFNKTISTAIAMAAGLTTFASVAEATVIVESNFVSVGSRLYLDGASGGLATNLPGGAWVWGAGWNWGEPFVPATWDSGNHDTVNLVEEDTALGISIADNGGYTKPTQIRLSADIQLSGSKPNTAGVGFWSTMPARLDGGDASSADNFTGLILNEVNGTLQVFSGGALTGDAVSVGALDEGIWYTIAYDIDTSTGSISNVMFEGGSVAGLSSTAFTDAATAFAGIRTGGNSRSYGDNIIVSEVPEPASLALMGLGGLLIVSRRTKRA